MAHRYRGVWQQHPAAVCLLGYGPGSGTGTVIPLLRWSPLVELFVGFSSANGVLQVSGLVPGASGLASQGRDSPSRRSWL